MTVSHDRRDWLMAVPHCPVCKERQRTPTPAPSAPGRYANAIAQGLGVDPAGLESIFQAYRCRRCTTLWADPWLSSRGMAQLYAIAEPRHESGWARLDRWRADPSRASNAEWASLFWDLLQSELGAVQSYAELNCPFWGLLPFLAIREPAIDRALVYEPTSCFWAYGCQRDGQTCRTLGMSELGARLLDFKDVKREGLRFDVVSIINCIDHFVDPTPVLKAAVASGRRVYVDSHDASGPFRRQHPFVLNARVLEHIARANGWVARDVTKTLGFGHRFAVVLRSAPA